MAGVLIIESCNTSCVGSSLLNMLSHADVKKNIHLAWVWAPCAFKKHARTKSVNIVHVSTCEIARSETPSTIQSPQVKSVDASVTSGFRTFENKQRAREVLSNVKIAIGAKGLAIKNNERGRAPEQQKLILQHPQCNIDTYCEMCTRAYILRTHGSMKHVLVVRECAWGVGIAAMRKSIS